MDFEWLPSAMMNINLYEQNINPVHTWSEQDCYNWAATEAERRGLPLQQIPLEKFYRYTGAQLSNFTLQDFTEKLTRKHGDVFYAAFQETLRNHNLEMKNNGSYDSLNIPEDSSDLLLSDISLEDSYLDSLLDFGALPPVTPMPANSPEHSEQAADWSTPDYVNLQPVPSISSWDDGSSGLGYEFPPASYPPCSSSPFSSASTSPSPSNSFSGNCSPPAHMLECEGAYGPVPGGEDWNLYLPPDTLQPPTEAFPPTQPRPRRKNPTTPPRETTEPQTGPLAPLNTTSRNRSRGPKNYEFIMRLLASPEYNPSLVQWVDQAEGTFKFNRPAEIARIWGQRSTNARENLSYDNFARGLRYHYTTGALIPVSERQLVYRCGPKALAFLRKELNRNARRQ